MKQTSLCTYKYYMIRYIAFYQNALYQWQLV